MQITQHDDGQVGAPGFYRMPEAVYHADPAPMPSLSSSIARTMLDRSPLHAWHAHPRLNPAHEAEESTRLDLGSIAHRLVLGAGADLEIIEAEDYRTKAAKEARDAAREAGRIPCLRSQFHQVAEMAEAARPVFHELFGGEPAVRAHAELVMIWREGPVWCRGMIDAISHDLRVRADYKTTADAAPAVFGRRLYDAGYHFQEAFYERGLAAMDPEGRGRRTSFVIAQEIDPPYAVSVHRVDAAGRMIAAKQAAAAIGMWTRCMETGEWPGFPGINTPELPTWHETSWLGREMTMEFHRPIEPLFT